MSDRSGPAFTMIRTYLGDGVYIEVEGDMIKLSTMRDTEHFIYLEPEVYAALVRFVTELAYYDSLSPIPAAPL